MRPKISMRPKIRALAVEREASPGFGSSTAPPNGTRRKPFCSMPSTWRRQARPDSVQPSAYFAPQSLHFPCWRPSLELRTYSRGAKARQGAKAARLLAITWISEGDTNPSGDVKINVPMRFGQLSEESRQRSEVNPQGRGTK